MPSSYQRLQMLPTFSSSEFFPDSEVSNSLVLFSKCNLWNVALEFFIVLFLMFGLWWLWTLWMTVIHLFLFWIIDRAPCICSFLPLSVPLCVSPSIIQNVQMHIDKTPQKSIIDMTARMVGQTLFWCAALPMRGGNEKNAAKILFLLQSRFCSVQSFCTATSQTHNEWQSQSK